MPCFAAVPKPRRAPPQKASTQRRSTRGDSIRSARYNSAAEEYMRVAGGMPQEPLTVGTITAAPGTTASGTLQVAPHGDDQGTTIPVTLINGAKPGPILALTAGVHGQEYPPILALQRL